MNAAANASIIFNMVPILMPFLLFFMIREKIDLREIIGTILALVGVVNRSVSLYRLKLVMQ